MLIVCLSQQPLEGELPVGIAVLLAAVSQHLEQPIAQYALQQHLWKGTSQPWLPSLVPLLILPTCHCAVSSLLKSAADKYSLPIIRTE